MNPVTRSLLSQVEDPGVLEFATHWDALEALVVRVFREGEATPDDQSEYRRLRVWLNANYLPLRGRLRPHWEAARVGPELAGRDPFVRLLAAQQAGDFVDDWEAMQALAGAREALNRFILQIIEADRARRSEGS